MTAHWSHLRRLLPQPLIGMATGMLALLALAASWLSVPGGAGAALGVAGTLICAGLIVATVAAYRFPLHLPRQTKVYLSSAPSYLLAVLAPVPLAATAAGVGVLCGELSVRTQRGTYPSDIASQVGRRVPIVLVASVVAHLPLPAGGAHLLALLGTAVVLEAGDLVTCPLLLAPICGERPWRVLVATAREAFLLESVQYLLGLLGVLVVTQAPWAAVPLLLPVVLLSQSLHRPRHARTAQALGVSQPPI